MKLIDRYVYAVTQYLPEDIREDVGKELRSNIEDMLPDNATEEDVYRVLEELGNPLKLACEYNPSKRYLIGPGYYDKYIVTLKTVLGIFIAVFVGIAMLTWVLDPPKAGMLYKDVPKLLADLLSAVFGGALQGAFWVTIIFVILERSGVEAGDIPYFSKKWTPNELPVLPERKNKKISRVETVVSMFFTILFTALVYFQPQLIAIYVKGDNGVVRGTPLWNTERLQSYLFLILILAILQLGIFIWKYLAGSWNIPLAIGSTLYNIAFCIVLVIMINDNFLWNQEFISVIADIIDKSELLVATWIDKSKWFTASVIIIVSVGESIASFLKCRNKRITIK